jgi:IMP dehydrogenase
MKYIREEAISYNDITIKPSYSTIHSRQAVSVSSNSYANPIVNAPMIHTSSIKMIEYFVDHDMMATVHRYFRTPSDQLAHVKNAVGSDYNKVFFAVGRNREDIQYLIDNGVDRFIADFAHGWSIYGRSSIQYIRRNSPNAIIVAGNVDSYEGYTDLISCGADIIRVGIASGKICSTNINTGVGIPMITALMDCARAKKKVGGLIIADGGIDTGGIIAKAMVFADMVMMGSYLASTNLAEGPFFDESGLQTTTNPKYCEFFGMASTKAREYNKTHDKNVSIEGVSGVNKYLGTTENCINNLVANMKASMSYVGVNNWEDYKKEVVIQRISNNALLEKMTHMYAID